MLKAGEGRNTSLDLIFQDVILDQVYFEACLTQHHWIDLATLSQANQVACDETTPIDLLHHSLPLPRAVPNNKRGLSRLKTQSGKILVFSDWMTCLDNLSIAHSSSAPFSPPHP